MTDGRSSVGVQPTAKRELARFSVAVRRRVGRAVDALATDPRPSGSKQLAGMPAERIWRIRVGDYRILYEIRDSRLVVLVIPIGHRREVYRGPRPRG